MHENKLFLIIISLTCYILGSFFLTTEKEILLSPAYKEQSTNLFIISFFPTIFIVLTIIIFLIALKKDDYIQ